MTETIPADFIDKPETGYVYVALLSENARKKITSLLVHLSQELPGTIWPMPSDALHITLCEIIQSRKPYSEDKTDLYNAHRETYEQLPVEIFSHVEPFNVRFDTIEASEHAIIVRATDDGQFAALRSELTQNIPMPPETKTPPDIIHSSIARYTNAVDLAKVQTIVREHAVLFDEPIRGFTLLKTIVPPLLEYQEIKNYPLGRE